jgi:hypothetical protein
MEMEKKDALELINVLREIAKELKVSNDLKKKELLIEKKKYKVDYVSERELF